ncbi:MAG: hypothetical protein LBR22_03740 [Desulfovibrio sp.]|nr:hypothetical protein [Desulfovibrio sp.]
MDILKYLFGKKEDNKLLHDAFEHVIKILDDDEVQMQNTVPMLREVIRKRPAVDMIKGGKGPFGLVETNPIPVNGPIGQISYLSKLLTDDSNEQMLFHRIGAIHTVDVFEAVTFDSNKWFILYVDFYHPRRSRLTPEGFHFSEIPAYFSGFHVYCKDFPYNFKKIKEEVRSDFSIAYIPFDYISEQLARKIYQRPESHTEKLMAINSRLTSRS